MTNALRLGVLAIGAIARATVAAETAREASSLPAIYSYRASEIGTLRKAFSHPPREAGPWVFWIFFDNVISKAEITRELEEMAAAGIAGAELRFLSMHGFTGSPGPWFDGEGWARLGQQRLEFLSPPFIDALEHACAEARRLGLRLAIPTGMGWPPGGPWIAGEHRSAHLVARSAVVCGKTPLRGDQALPVPPGAMVFAWRVREGSRDGKEVDVPSFQDLSSRVTAQNRLEWDVPDGRWLMGTFHRLPGGLCDKGNGPEADPGSRDAMLFHLDHVFSRLQPRLGKYFGSTLIEVTSDSWEYERGGDARYWSPAIVAEFPAVAGYDLRKRLYTLLGYGPDREKTLADVDRVEREVVRSNFFATLTEYVNARALRHRPQVRGRGLARDFFQAFAGSDTPEIEEEVFLPEAVWVAHALGKPIVSAEAFTFLSGHSRNLEREGQQRLHQGPLADPKHEWETNLAMLRWHAGAHFARGVNRIQMHSFGYSPCGLPPPGWRIYAEVHLNRNVPWWPYAKCFTAWAARTQWVLQSGVPAADALVYPVRANPPDGPFNQATDQPVAAINAVDGISRDILARLETHSVSPPYDGSRLVLIDDVRTSDEARRILKWVERGAIVSCCRAMPDDWTALQGAAGGLERLREGFREAIRRERVLDARAKGWQSVLADAQSVRWTPASARLSFQHRRVQGADVYFLTNWDRPFSGEVSFPHPESTPEIWDADTGATLPAAQYRTISGRMAVFLSLDRHESLLVVFARARPSLHAARCEGGCAARLPDGKLEVRFDGPGPCRVDLSDGRTREFHSHCPKPAALDGPWTLTASPEQGFGLTEPARAELQRLVSWREIPALRTYAGIGRYQTELVLPSQHVRDDLGLVLELGEVYELADVWLNGRHVATRWFPPYRLDLTGHVRAGKNSIRIDVPNILKNHLEQGDYGRPSGLLGPVRIRFVGRAVLQEGAP